MSEIECPYCEKQTEICHDDGFGYEEDTPHEIECDNCGKNFIFYTEISHNFYPQKADCLNGSNHDYKLTSTHPKCFSKMRCSMCDDERELNEEERKTHDVQTKEEFWKELDQNKKDATF